MKSYWIMLNDRDRDAVRTVMAFLNGRLSERHVVNWALKTKSHDLVKRIAVLQSLESVEARKLKDPWRAAWRLIEESWEREMPRSLVTQAYDIQRRITSGERTGSLIAATVATVQPTLIVRSHSEPSTTSVSKRPQRVEDLLYASLGSNRLTDLHIYKLETISEVPFLVALGIALESAVNDGIALGRRLGWMDDHKFWRLGQLYYVGYRVQEECGRIGDVDEFHEGIAPSVKLLHAVVERIAVLNPGEARKFLFHWKQASTLIHLRLWASLSQIVNLTPAAELTESLPGLQDRPFWDIQAFPEIAELRALRFSDMTADAQNKVLNRLTKGPPRTIWSRSADKSRVKIAREYWATRELRRIYVAGNRLPTSTFNWLSRRLENFPDLINMDSIRFGFLSIATVEWVDPETNDDFSELVSDNRLRALEAALTSTQRSWNDDPSERARNWIQSGNNASLLLAELEASPDGGADFPNIWDRFGWSHNATNRDTESASEDRHIVARVLTLLERLPDATIMQSIQGITYWVSSWERIVAQSPKLVKVWAKLWPIAVIATNETVDASDTPGLNQLVETGPDQEPLDLDTINTASGRLVGVFLSLCPTLQDDNNPFATNDSLRYMRSSIISAAGKSGLIARHRLIEWLPYFLKADEEWSRRHLITPLSANDDQSLALWRSIARRTQFTAVLRVIGGQFADRAVDRRLGRKTQSSLLSSLVFESLHAFREKREPAIANAKVQQTLRAVDDEVRANAAQSVKRFQDWMAHNDTITPQRSADEVFLLTVAPFLKIVWPQERSLATRGVSAAFAELPFSAGEAFSEAVNTIDRFLVPFDCWSMFDFGLPGDEGGPQVAVIDTPEMAAAFLHMLNLCIGSAEGSVIPLDLAEALDQIRSVAGSLVHNLAFRRLETLARQR